MALIAVIIIFLLGVFSALPAKLRVFFIFTLNAEAVTAQRKLRLFSV
jgi:hypothetical protein